MNNNDNLKSGDVVAAFVTFKKTGERYLFYGEVVEAAEGALKIATAVKCDASGKLLPKLQAFTSDKWEMAGIVKFAAWKSGVLFGNHIHGQPKEQGYCKMNDKTIRLSKERTMQKGHTRCGVGGIR